MECASLLMRVKRIASGPLTVHELSAQSARGHPRDTEKGCASAHVLLYPTLDFLKRLANGSVPMHQIISAQSIQPLLIRKWGTSARAQAHVHTRLSQRSAFFAVQAGRPI